MSTSSGSRILWDKFKEQASERTHSLKQKFPKRLLRKCFGNIEMRPFLEVQGPALKTKAILCNERPGVHVRLFSIM